MLMYRLNCNQVHQAMGPSDLYGSLEESRPRLRNINTSKSASRRAPTPAAVDVEEEPVTPAGRVFMQPNLNCYILCTLGFQELINVAEFKDTLSETLVKHKRFHSILVSHDFVPVLPLAVK